MAKLFVAAVPCSECKSHLDRIKRSFEDECPCEMQDRANDKDAVYFSIDETDKHQGLADVLHYNLTQGKYATLGSMIKMNTTTRILYGLYRAEVKPGDYTMEQFIKEGG